LENTWPDNYGGTLRQRHDFGHRRSEWHGSVATDRGGERPGGDGGMACLDTRGQERDAASNQLSGRAAGQCFMAWEHTWQRCRSSWRQLEMERRCMGPGTESLDRLVGPQAKLFLN
jgi:hypothetical protein